MTRDFDRNQWRIARINEGSGKEPKAVVLFDYFGYGDFIVKCYNNRASEIIYPTIEPLEFFKTEKAKSLRLDEFIFDRKSLEIEKQMGNTIYDGIRNDPDDFRLKVILPPNWQKLHNVLPKGLEDLYKEWKGLKSIKLTFSLNEWEIEIYWIEDRCIFGNGWTDFVKESELSIGDVVAMHIWDDPKIVNVCIFKKDEMTFDKEAGIRSGGTSFYKVALARVLQNGYVLVPTLCADECEIRLSGTKKISIAEHEWNIIYNEKWRILHGLDKLLERFSLDLYDSIHFTFGEDGVFSGRIYKKDGMEMKYARKERRSSNRLVDDFFLFEDWIGDSELIMMDIDNVKESNPIVVEDAGNAIGDVIGNVENNVVQVFSKKVYGCNFDNRCHGVYIPETIKFRNRDWQKGDVARFRTNDGTWDIGIIMSQGKARFSAGWSKFIREQKVKKNDNLRFTLIKADVSAVFDIEINPII